MKTLIVEDDFTSRLLMQEFLSPFGVAYVAVDGEEAVRAVEAAYQAEDPFDLICLDIMMPKMNGQEALLAIREVERAAGREIGQGASIVMTTALSDKDNILTAFRASCEGYLIKPFDKKTVLDQLRVLELID